MIMPALYYITSLFAKVFEGRGDLGIPTKDATAASIHPILNLVYMIAAIVAVIVIIIAGINYATSGGDAGKVAKAKNTILYSVVGLVIVAFAFTITLFIVGRFE